MGSNTARWGQVGLSKARSTGQGLGVLRASFKEQERRWPVSGDPVIGSSPPWAAQPTALSFRDPYQDEVARWGDVGGWERSCDTISEKGSDSVSLGSLTRQLGRS